MEYSSADGSTTEILDSASLSFTNDELTISCLVKFTAFDSAWHLVSKNSQWRLGLLDSNTIRNLVKTNGTTGWAANDDSYSFSTDTWYSLDMAYDGAKLINYVNGIALSSGFTVTGNIVDNSNHVYLNWNGDKDGVLDEVRIANTGRTAAYLKFKHHNIFEPDNELTWGSMETESGGVAPPYRVSAGLVTLAGARAGRQGVTGSVAGQSFTPGILAGAIHG
jgi:hypothetical protein